MKTTTAEVASQVLEVVPAVMRALREQMRSHRGADLTVAQFRTLAYIDRHTGTSLSAVADHIGLTLPSMSKLVDGLVARKLVLRDASPNDRRRMTLELTVRGRSRLAAARSRTRTYLTSRLDLLDAAALQSLSQALAALAPLFLEPAREHSEGIQRRNGNS